MIDPKSPLYDERVHNGPTERMVRSIMHRGVVQPIVIAKNPETGATEVVAGRQRVINAREANRRLVERGDEPIQVPAYARKLTGNGGDLAEVGVIENELREPDSPLGRARKMQRLADLGRDEESIGLAFGCTAATVRSTLALLEAPAAVRQAVDTGAVTLKQAKQLAKLAPDEQRAKVAELQAASEGAKPHEKAAKQRAVLGDVAPKMRTRKEIVAKRDEQVAGSDVRALLDWVLGLA